MNDLPESVRSQVSRSPQQPARGGDRPPDANQAGTLERQRPNFIGLHKLFDEIDEAVEEYVDLLAERVVQLADCEGTARVVAERLGSCRSNH